MYQTTQIIITMLAFAVKAATINTKGKIHPKARALTLTIGAFAKKA